jgi:hypothetical protein
LYPSPNVEEEERNVMCSMHREMRNTGNMMGQNQDLGISGRIGVKWVK